MHAYILLYCIRYISIRWYCTGRDGTVRNRRYMGEALPVPGSCRVEWIVERWWSVWVMVKCEIAFHHLRAWRKPFPIIAQRDPFSKWSNYQVYVWHTSRNFLGSDRSEGRWAHASKSWRRLHISSHFISEMSNHITQRLIGHLIYQGEQLLVIESARGIKADATTEEIFNKLTTRSIQGSW
jgi:hypothetical protein